MKRELEYPVGLYLVIGRRGTGKTTLMRELVEKIGADQRQIVLIHDRRAQLPATYWESDVEFRTAVYKEPKLPKVNGFARVSAAKVSALAVELAERGMRVLLVIDELDRLCAGNTRFVDDPPRVKGDTEGTYGPTKTITHEGRHIGRPPGNFSPLWGVTLLGSARRPTNLHVDLGELAELIFFFPMNGRNSLKWVEETAGDSVAAQVARLPKFKHVRYDPADVSDLPGAVIARR